MRIVYGLGDPFVGMIDKESHVYSTRFNRSIITLNNWLNPNFKINTSLFAISIRAQNSLGKPTSYMLWFVVGGSRQRLLLRQVSISLISSISMLENGEGSWSMWIFHLSTFFYSLFLVCIWHKNSICSLAPTLLW